MRNFNRSLELLLKRIDVRPDGRNPVCGESIGNQPFLIAEYMRRRQKNSFQSGSSVIRVTTPIGISRHRACGYAQCNNAGTDISGYYCASTDHCPVTDRPLRHDRSSDADQGTNADPHITAEMDARSNVDMIADPVVMIYRAPCVENGVCADHGARIYDNARADHTPRADRDVGSDYSPRVAGNGESCAFGGQLTHQLLAHVVVADGHKYRVVWQADPVGKATQNGKAEETLAQKCGIVIQIARYVQILIRVSHAQQNIGHYLPMATCTKNQQTHTCLKLAGN
jgi:hypothetical protein